ALIGAEAAFVALYVHHEREIYAWDHVMYFDMAHVDFALFGRGFAQGWAAFRASLANNYNYIFALPSFVGFYLFGVTRTVFLVTNFLVFFVAYETAFAFVLRRALGWDWARAFLFSVVAAALVPPLWLSLLEGYPDIGAAGLIVFGFGFAATARMGRDFWRDALAVGLCLGAAIILRRHFAYPALALLATAGVLGFAEMWGKSCKKMPPPPAKTKDLASPQAKWVPAFAGTMRKRIGFCFLPLRGGGSSLLRAVLFSLIAGVTVLALLAAVEPGYLHDALTINYTWLYGSYKRPALYFMSFVGGIFGLGLLALGASGVWLLARAEKSGRKLALFVTAFTLIWLVMWCAGPCQAAHHYLLHAVPLFVLTGLAGWFAFLIGYPAKKNRRHARLETRKGVGKFLPGFLIAALVFNSAYALWFSPVRIWPSDDWPVGIMSAPRPPVVRPDYAAWIRLAKYLQKTTTPAERIYVIGSSIAYSTGVLYSVFGDILHDQAMLPRILQTPEIDRLSPAPLDAFASADVYVVAAPAQYHLDPKGQKVVTAAFDQFPPPAARADLFTRDPVAFHLADGITVHIWRRKEWPPGKLHAALMDIRRIAQAGARFRQDWVTVALPLHAEDFTNAHNLTNAIATFDRAYGKWSLFFDDPLAGGSYRLAFRAENLYCPLPRWRLTAETANGKRVLAGDFAHIDTRDGERDFSLPPGGDYFLRLDFKSGDTPLCEMLVKGLRVEKNF
ncbi:MAG TPA: hypothetical protein VMV79_06720, partial [Alphaproteobacteria bacterium]|nr:hypothetical protein [Alphaproteobacteria bacterium]